MATRNPPWTRDELILALDLFFRHNPSHLSQTHPAVIELSQLLNTLPSFDEVPDQGKFRNPNGVYMKLANFLRLDPNYHGAGLERGSKEDINVWDEFASDRDRLTRVAAAIRAAVSTLQHVPTAPLEDVDEDEAAPEGRLLLRMHRVRERNRSLANKKKRQAIQRYGRLSCEVCTFDFEERYGPVGKCFIEAHHVVPLATLDGPTKVRLKDLALVCSNCHRMLHRQGDVGTIEDLREQFASMSE